MDHQLWIRPSLCSNKTMTSSTLAPGRQNNRLMWLMHSHNSVNWWHIMESPTRYELASSSYSSKNWNLLEQLVNYLTYRLAHFFHGHKTCIWVGNSRDIFWWRSMGRWGSMCWNITNPTSSFTCPNIFLEEFLQYMLVMQ